MKYIKRFPNCRSLKLKHEDNEPKIPNNVIIYKSPAKLVETTSDKSSGLHTNAFNTTIVSHKFENGVGTIEFEDDVTTIGNYAFYGCSSLTNITIPDSVTSIGKQTFQSCSGLTSVTIPDSVTSIGNAAFINCSGLTSVEIGNGVTSIDTSAFMDCGGLTSIIVKATTPPTLATNVFGSTNDCPIYVPAESVEAYKAASHWSSYADRIQAIQ